MRLRDLEAGQLAIVLTGLFEGEIFYRNVAGIQSLTKDRYWPSAQAKVTGHEHFHEGPLDEEIELINKDRLKYLLPVQAANSRPATVRRFILTVEDGE